MKIAMHLKRLIADTRGATAVEYGLVLALVVLTMLAALQNLAGVTVGKWDFVANQVTGV